MTDTYNGYAIQRRRLSLSRDCAFDLTWPTDADALLDTPETLERFERDEYLPYWAELWPSSLLLAKEILKREPVEGGDAIELGCGIGLVSLAAAVRGWSITASDYDADAVAFAQLNAHNNGIALADAKVIDFRRPAPEACYDAVFAADLTYEARNAEPLARWIAAALKPNGFACVSDPNRRVADAFPDCAIAAGLTIETRSVEMDHPDGYRIHGRIWHLMRDQQASPPLDP